MPGRGRRESPAFAGFSPESAVRRPLQNAKQGRGARRVVANCDAAHSGLMPISCSTAIISSVSRRKRALVASKLSGPTIM